MRKPELAAAIADKADLSKEQASRALNAILDEITQALSRKDTVTSSGLALSCSATVVPARGRTRRPASRSRSRPATPLPSSPARG